MRFILHILLFQCLLICQFNKPVKGQTPVNSSEKALRIVKLNAVLLDSIHQVLVVFNETPEQNSAVLVAMEKRNKVWRMISAPMPLGIGR